MNNKLTVLLAITAGFAGGLLSRYAAPSGAYAQGPTVQQEARARKFVLVDGNGATRGVFGIETDGTVQIEVADNNNRMWMCRMTSPELTWRKAIENRPKVLTLIP